MPRRIYILATGEYYHVFNRSVDKRPIFASSRECKRAIDVMYYYSFDRPPIRFSKFLMLSDEQRNLMLDFLNKKGSIVNFIAYCIMPNHFHFLLKQKVDYGISKFLANFQNSYAHYFNTKSERKGPIWQGQFKAVRIEDDLQLLHVSRYIHLNPYTSFVVPSVQALQGYTWSSLPEYIDLGTRDIEICEKSAVLAHFNDREKYKQFVFDQADYQRKLEEIKHLVLE